MELYRSNCSGVFLRGDIYYADLDQGTASGSEQKGSRPVIIIQNDIGNRYSSTVIVAIITSQEKKPLPTHVEIYAPSILKYKSTICLEQIKTIDKSRLTKYLGSVDGDVIARLDKAISASVGLDVSDDKAEAEPSAVRRDTIYDGVKTNWLEMARQQMSFFGNIGQYIINLKLDIAEIDNAIDEIMNTIENDIRNAAEGYKVYRSLREHRIRRRAISDELKQLEAFLTGFDCTEMLNAYEGSVSRMQCIVDDKKAV